jgi:hypothetical protein
MTNSNLRCGIVVCRTTDPPLEALLGAAVRGVERVGGAAVVGDEEALDCDALLVATPVVLYGLPADVKSIFDSWAGRVPDGSVIPRTSRMRAGYLSIHHPDDPAIPELFHRQMRALFGFFGMDFRGKAGGFAPAGAAQPADAGELATAQRLGEVLCGAEGMAGYAPEYLAGIDLFNKREYWEAHEAWEELWLEAETPLRAYYQALIQATAAFHHLGHENWGGMASLLDEAIAKLETYRPRTEGLDIDGFLAQLAPWLDWAKARLGRPEPVTRRPSALPEIRIG